MNRRNLSRRLDRLEALAPRWNPPDIEIVFVNDGEPGGLRSVRGPDDRHVWWNPPAGCKVGELIEDSVTPRAEARLLGGHVLHKMSVVFMEGREGGPGGPKAEPGPDGRLVWSEPAEGCQVGEPIEDSAASMRLFGESPHQHEYDRDPLR
jgi:hypothetical protein